MLDQPVRRFFQLDWEKGLYLILIIAALFTRMSGVGERVPSHDESIHTLYSWNLYTGRGFRHNPLMHGPFLFHITAFSYFLFGDTDFTARLPVALMGVALVIFPYFLRRWLGRAGALFASFFLLISPSIAYYSRYIRHDIPSIVWALLMVLAILSYLRDGRKRWLLLLAAGVGLIFATKEVSFIYSAIFGFFLIGLFVVQAVEREWREGVSKDLFFIPTLLVVLSVSGVLLWAQARPEEPLATPIWVYGLLGVAGLGVVGALGGLVWGHLDLRSLKLPSPVVILLIATVAVGIVVRFVVPLFLGLIPGTSEAFQATGLPPRVDLVLSLLPLACGVVALVAWVTIRAFESYKAFDLVIVLGTLCLPYLSAFVIAAAGLNPTDYNPPTIYYSGAITVQVLLVSVVIGLMWDFRRQTAEKEGFGWLIAAAIHYAIFLVFYTTVFTNGDGIGTGLIGSLGYWIEQQAVERGSQPWYYYMVMAPLYDYLPLLLALIGVVLIAVRSVIRLVLDKEPPETPAFREYFIAFVLWWMALAWIAYSYAGERMPWLLVHISLPMILFGGWLVGRFIDGVDWRKVLRRRAWLTALLLPPFVLAIVMLVQASAAGPFDGVTLTQLQITGKFLGGLVATLGFGAGFVIVALRSGWQAAGNVTLVLGLVILVGLTVHTAWQFCFINEDYPTEYLVYAHATPGVGHAMDQIEVLSRRYTGGPEQIKVAYGADASTMFHWQLRNYDNAVFYGTTPSRDQMEAPVIIAGQGEWEAVRPYVVNDYEYIEYEFIWWPMEDYRHINWQSIKNWMADPQKREAIWDIWFARDYELYDQITGKSHTLDSWPLRSLFRIYIRRDALSKIWELSTIEPDGHERVDPYAEGRLDLTAEWVWGSEGTAQGQLQGPRGVDVGPEGDVYVADTGNHRIQKFTAEGESIAAWGQESTVDLEEGSFKEPWDVAVDEDGSVYVADTWNHRIQKLDADGTPVAVWGSFGQPEAADQAKGLFYGPRGIAVGPEGNVYVADTGNKRIQVFDPDGEFLRQWGSGGVIEGHLDEPVGIAVGPTGEVYVADTWNRRVQVFDAYGTYLREWSIAGWDVGTPEEKPYLAVGGEDRVYVTDPGRSRVLVFDTEGTFLALFGEPGTDEGSFIFPQGIAVGEDGGLYVTDAHTDRVLGFGPLGLE